MPIVGTHRGAVSGKLHVHLLRESAAERAAKAAAQYRAAEARTGSETTADRSSGGQDSEVSIAPRRRFG